MIQTRNKQEKNQGIPYFDPTNKLYEKEKITSQNNDTWRENHVVNDMERVKSQNTKPKVNRVLLKIKGKLKKKPGCE